MKTKDQVQDLLKKMGEVEDLAKKIEAGKIKSVTLNKESKVAHPIAGADSDERRAMRAFGAGSVKHLLQINTAHPDFRNVPENLKQVARELKKSVDIGRAIAQMFHDRKFDHITGEEKSDRIMVCKNLLSTRYGKEVLAPRMKAFGSTVVGGGDEWVPTIIANNYIQEYELDFVLENRFDTIPMRSSPFELPVQSGVKKARKIGENTAITDTSFTTDKITFTAVKMGEYYILPEELTEDSAVDFLPIARDEVVRAQIRAAEAALINGDNDGTHPDSDTQAAAADVAEKLWRGLRAKAITNSANGGTHSFGGAAVTEANLRDLRANLGKFGVNPTELLFIAGPAVYQQLQALPSVKTLDVFGPMATVLKGALSAYQGIPIVTSEYMRETLNASGVYDGVTTDRAGLILVNTRRFYFGQRRPIIVKAQYDLPNQDRFLIASYQRKDFQAHVQSATEVSVAYGINILV